MYGTSTDELFWKNDFLDYCDDSMTVLTTSGIQSGFNLDFFKNNLIAYG